MNKSLYTENEGDYKYSSAQLEVWEMKKRIYENVKNMPLEEALKEILMNSKILTEKLIEDKKLIFH